MNRSETTASRDDGEINNDNDAVEPNDSRPPAVTAASAAPVVPSKRRIAQERAREEERTVPQVLRWVDDIAPEAFAGMTANRRYVLGAKLVRKARAWGMTDPRDMAIFCALWRYPGKAFFERPAWLKAAERVKNGETTWPIAFEDPQIWEEPQQGT